MMSTLRRTSSAARAGSLSYFPSDDRKLDRAVPPGHVAKTFQSVGERAPETSTSRVRERNVREDAYPIEAVALLRSGNHGRGEEARQCAKERPALHYSIT